MPMDMLEAYGGSMRIDVASHLAYLRGLLHSLVLLRRACEGLRLWDERIVRVPTLYFFISLTVSGDYAVAKWLRPTHNEGNTMKKLNLITLVALSLAMASCGSKTYLITSGNENLRSLTKVTEGKNPSTDPGGSTESNILFFTTQINYNERNIYKKDNPVAPAQIQFTSGAPCSDPTYCVATDRVAFSRLVNRTYDIYMMPASKGNALIPVTETPGDNEFAPSFSPNGEFLAYQKGYANSTSSEIWMKNLKTGENMLLGQGCCPAISPDGKKIAYAKVESGKTRNIWIMDVDGSNAQQLSASKEEFAGFPAWSPSGKKIVYQSNKKSGNFDIFVMNADGTGIVQLTTNESDDFEPFWSKDGYIYMTSDRGSKKNEYNIWRFFYED